MSQEKAASYVPQIKAAYGALLASHKKNLAHALTLGSLLNDAKTALGKKGKWTEWLAEYCPQISHRTANIYMKLAKHKDKFTDETNSQRAAIKALELDFGVGGGIALVVLNAEEGRAFIEMGRQGPKISVVSRDWKSEWCLDEPDKSVPLIEELIPQLETAGPRARKCAEKGKKILARWEGLKSGARKPTEAELRWLARHVKFGPGISISVTSKKPEIVNRAAEIAEKILGTPQVVERKP